LMQWMNQYDLIPLERYKQQRAAGTAVQDPTSGSWSVYSYEGVKQIHANYEQFSSQFWDIPPADEPIESSILRRDPPKHKQMRSIVAKAFTARFVGAMEPRIRKIAEELLDRAAGAGSLEVVGDLANPLPVIVIAEMLACRQATGRCLRAGRTISSETTIRDICSVRRKWPPTLESY